MTIRHVLVAALAAAALVGCSSSEQAAETTAVPPATEPAATEPAPTEPGTDPPTPQATAAATTVPVSTAEPEDSTAIEQTRTLFAGVAADHPGCTVAVSRQGQVVFAEAYGASRLEPLTPMDTDTVVDIGSTSKQFTATAILLLHERGFVDLDAPVWTYLPDLPGWAQQVTVQQMVHHQSGIPDYIGLLNAAGVDTSEPSNDADALRELGKVTALEFEPGTKFAYSNSNYFLLGQIVLAVTGDDLGAFLDEEVFRPLGMDAVMDPTAIIPAKATSYGQTADGWVIADSPWTQLGDGAIQTTPTELLKWAAQYWSPTIGSPEINDRRLDGAVDTDFGPRYGFGITETELDGTRVLSHPGGWGGFVTTFVVVPDQQLAVAGTCASPESIPATDNPDIGLTIAELWLA